MLKLILLLTPCIGFAQNLNVTLTPSLYNGGYNISCFGFNDGSISTTVTGGTAPYTYNWSNSTGTANQANLPAGYYSVTVTDVNNQSGSKEITLTEPLNMQSTSYVHRYNNGYNVSCYGCDNGMIFIDISGGVPPYEFEWMDGYLDQDRWGLTEGSYSVVVNDQNDCMLKSETFDLFAPDRSDWTMQGNSGTNAGVDFIGTTDNKDLVFKTSLQERMRVTAGGIVKLSSLATGTEGYLMADETGNVFKATPNDPPVNLPVSWKTNGNLIGSSNPNYLGTLDEKDLIIKTFSTPRVWITGTQGRVGIGTSTPSAKLEIAHEDETGGIVVNQNGINGFKKSEIKFNYQGNELWALGNSTEPDGTEAFFLWYQPGNILPMYINGQARKIWLFEQPDNSSTSDYRLYVGGGIAARELKVMVGPFPDFVFDENYKLTNLYELESYISKNKHLPDIPSMSEVKENKGIEVGDFQVKLLQKIEELTLYIIEQQKQIDALKLKVDNKSN